jgi:hypothetical protein
MSEQTDAEKRAAEIMSFRHTDNDPPTNIVVNGVPIVVDEDSTISGIAKQIIDARNTGN